jgi:uncharacterized protein YjbI with pentapeptide repeats
MRARLLTARAYSAVGVFALTAGMLAVTAGTAQAAVTCPTVDAKTGAVTPAPSAGVDWTGCNLSNASLANANFANATLTGANLSGATLTSANFNGAGLSGATLTKANLTSASIPNADLSSANLTGANLTQAIIKATSLNKTVMAGTTLTKVVGRQITGVPASLPTNWAVISGSLVGPGADLSNDNLTGAQLNGLDLNGTDFDGSNLTGANLANSTLVGASFVGTVVTGANLDGVNLIGDNITGIVSGGVTGTPAGLPAGWSLLDGFLIGPGASLSGANLAGQNLSGANLSGINLSNANLVSTNLSGANLTGSDLTGANLTGADLFRANLGGVTWNATTCPNSKSSTGIATGCARQLAFRFGGLTAPAPGSSIRKSARSFSVRFRLTNFHGKSVTSSIGGSLTSAKEVRVSLTGPGITKVNASCSWSASLHKFKCTVHFSGKVKTGKSHNYKVTVSENYGRGWAKAPKRAAAVNPAIVHFK